ncbi:MAG: ABC transporter ATP-binding protein [Methanobrevibacter ruminantium]|uniref:ABC transporter ATP-binding protein n=1 Tax=Methanobrevibacter ruminantium TaxID=83816 RepID=UPI0026EABED6|nr:ABC transporter ATP-binding protein [Methanobrevibacter ruminantium]MDO5842626.1 ABC transporter ATP-binding protein [Methanobrevibacter ruminantium]
MDFKKTLKTIGKLLSPLKKSIIPLILIVAFLLIDVYCNLTLPKYTADIVDVGIQNTDFNYIISVGTMMMAMVLIGVFATIGLSYFSSKVSAAYGRDLRKISYEKILKFSNFELNKISRASLITRNTNDVYQIQIFLGLFFTTILFSPILGIGSILKAMELGTNLLWIIAVTFAAAIIPFVIIFIRTVPYFKVMQELTDKINQTSREILMGIPVIKAFVRQDYEEERFRKTNEDFKAVNLNVFRILLVLLPAMILLLNLMIVLILYFGAYDAIQGEILTGTIIAFIQYATQIVMAFLMMGGFLVMIPRILVSGRRVAEVINTEITISDGPINTINDNPVIEFKDVAYSYPGSEKETLKDINFKLEKGKTTAIIGGTGSGKSTILNLIPRLQDVTGGEILVNGKNIKDYKLTTLRERISYAPQKAILFEGTIRSNMLIGKEDASDEEIEKALKMAEVDFIESLDDGVSQGASNYSGGQKQRLQLARSILGKRDFYLFDDCFSALDMNTEAKVKENLKSLKENSSMLIVSQRISTIMDADEIIVLDEGEIIDKGSHDYLNENCKIYREIVSSQIDRSKDLLYDNEESSNYVLDTSYLKKTAGGK